MAGFPTLREIFHEKYYGELEGGILEGLGRMFSGKVKLYVYPTKGFSGGDLLYRRGTGCGAETPAPLRVPVRKPVHRAHTAL